MATMYDAVTPTNIPAEAEIVAGYIDGRYQWRKADWDRFRHSLKVRIAVSPYTFDGDVLDCERGDATAAQTCGWVKKRRDAGADPTVYCSRIGSPGYGWPDVRAAFRRVGEPEPHYWIADYTGRPHLLAGSVATQYANPGPVDLSVTNGVWPASVVPPPTPVPIVTHYPGDNMHSITFMAGALDEHGNGYLDEPGVDGTKVVSVVFDVQDPHSPGGYSAHPPDWGKERIDGTTRVVFFAGAPRVAFGGELWVADA